MFSGVCGKWRFFGWRQVQGDFRISGTQPDFPRWTGRATRDTRNNRQDLCRSNFSKGGHDEANSFGSTFCKWAIFGEG